MGTVFTALVAIAFKLFFTMSADKPVNGFSIELVAVRVPPRKAAMIGTKPSCFILRILMQALPAFLADAGIVLHDSAALQLVSPAKGFDGVWGYTERSRDLRISHTLLPH
ncbi:MAG: hypothetical protein ACOX4A_08620 [Saccharofermentanales bacterium]